MELIFQGGGSTLRLTGDDAVIVAWWLNEHASRHPNLSLDLGALKLREDGDDGD